MSDTPATKPEGEDNKADATTITIRVRDQTGEEVYFKVKKTTRMEKVFNSYATRKGVQLSALRFLIDGQRVHNNDTPAKLELEDQDQIDCMLEQQGGCISG